MATGHQPGWKWCWKCQCLFYSRNPSQGICPADHQPHDGSGSGNYALAYVPPSGGGEIVGQTRWRWCSKCQGLYFSGNASQGHCPADNLGHGNLPSYNYVLVGIGTPGLAIPVDGSEQRQWFWCNKCQQLFFAGNGSEGVCPAGETHSPTGSGEYLLSAAGPFDEITVARLLVIGPEAFRAALQPLIDHKNSTGMLAFFASREALTGYYRGRDDPERIKVGIETAFRTLQTRYVMLVGDASLIPVRYRCTSIPPGQYNWRTQWYSPADLYYGNLYLHRQAGNTMIPERFATWDADNNGLFNEQHWINPDDAVSFNPDNVDGYADVAVGRVPAHTADEVATYVTKVIAYEQLGVRPLNRIAVLTDKDYPDSDGYGHFLVAEGGIQLQPGWDISYTGLWYGPSEPVPNDLVRGDNSSIAAAAGSRDWLFYVGHGWNDGWGGGGEYASEQANMLTNFTDHHNLPIVFAAGCSTGQFVNCPPQGRYLANDGSIHWIWYNNDPDATPPINPTHIWDFGPNMPPDGHHMLDLPSDWQVDQTAQPMMSPPIPGVYDFPDRASQSFANSWLFNPRGGAVAYFGEITVAQDNWGRDFGGYLLQGYGFERAQILGDCWLHAQQQYWRTHHTNENIIGSARIYLCYMTMFGDPSLRL